MSLQIADPELKKRAYKLLDKVFKTGASIELERDGKRLLICPAEPLSKLDRLEDHAEFIVGDPDDLVHLDWFSEWKSEL